MSSSQKKNVKSQLSQLQSAIEELRDNISVDRPQRASSYSPERDVALELDKMKSSFANMLDLLMNELDAVKKDLYVDFGEAQKLIAEDIKQLLSDAKLHNLRLDALEKDRRAQLPAAGMRAAPDLEARVDYLESLVLRMETSSLKDSEKPRLTSNGNEALDRCLKVTKTNCEQIEQVISQNQRIEAFLEEVAELLGNNQRTSIELNQKLIAAESDVALYKKELADLFKDFESRISFYQQSQQNDSGNILKVQKETNKNIETFVSLVNKKNAAMEETVKARLDGFQELIQQISRKELNDELLKSINEQVATVHDKMLAAERRLHAQESRMSNIKNEINLVFDEYSKDVFSKLGEFSSAITSLAKQTGVRNPLL